MQGEAGFKRWASILVQITLFVTGLYSMRHARSGTAAARPVSYSEFIENLRQGRVEAVRISSTELRVRPEWRIEQDLIGGVRAEVGNMVFDGSVRARLELLRERLAADPVPGRALAQA
jgi:hypothetical protein